MTMRPKQFYLAALLLTMIALSFPVQVMALYGHSLSEWSAILSKITGFNWLVMVSLLVAAYYYFQGSRVILVLGPLAVALVAINNYWVGQFAGDYSLLQTSLGTLCCGLIFAPLGMPSSMVVLQDPKRRWWRRSKRHHKRLETTLNPFVGDMIHAHTFDVSQTGAFICLEDELTELPKVGDRVRLSFTVNSMKKIRCEAVVVRISEAKGHYPKGMGVRFVSINKNHERSFESLLKEPSLH